MRKPVALAASLLILVTGATGAHAQAAPVKRNDTVVKKLTPRAKVERMVRYAVRTGDFPGLSPRSVLQANKRHGPTINGTRSDHQGPGRFAWAADMSNGDHPTPEMDALAQHIADKYHIDWTGAGVGSVTRGTMRYSILYRTMEGGNHFNHVHFGIRRVDRTPPDLPGDPQDPDPSNPGDPSAGSEPTASPSPHAAPVEPNGSGYPTDPGHAGGDHGWDHHHHGF